MKPAIVVAGLRSGVGKTTVTLGLIRALTSRGKKVAAFKIGPDFLDPSHYTGAGADVARNLDPILQGTRGMRRSFSAADGCDAVIVEGVMGLLDGPYPGKITASTADVAKQLGLPILLVCDGRSCAQSIAAEAAGAKALAKGVAFLGVILNHVGSKRHAELLIGGIAALARLPVLGCLFRETLPAMPSRHLGLVPAAESRPDNSDTYRQYGKAISDAIPLDRLCARARKLRKTFSPGGRINNGTTAPAPITVAIARDEAFSFYYPETLEFLESRAARVISFSPLNDRHAPQADLYYFGGGFPEVYASRLSENRTLRAQLSQNFREGAKAYAECGGLMYLSNAIVVTGGSRHEMVGALPGTCAMHSRRQALGYWKARVKAGGLFLKAGMRMIGHEYHWSTFSPMNGITPVYAAKKVGAHETQNGGWRTGNIFASYLHLSPYGNLPFFSSLLKWAAAR